ncbi:M23 family metallopeptidase [Priestia megaterium]|uniref:M23 family metallopeptidase n=1 Tax=Priestia megaterium TaxID=1404 RepID=UPI0035D67BB7
MKRFIPAVIILYALVYMIYPIQSYTHQSVKKKDVSNKIELTYKENSIMLTNFKDDGNERYWGELNHYPYMIYKDIDKYIYVNGQFYAVKGKWESNAFLLPEGDAKKLFNLSGSKGSYTVTKTTGIQVCKNVDKEKVLNVLSGPHIPIDHAFVTKEPGQVPGAARDYRNGKHEGFDWYPGAIGIEITRQTLIHPLFEGRIVRIDKNFKELEFNHREVLLKEAAESNNTSQKTLDKLRGRQVWIQSKNGVLVHYAHTSSVNPELKVGDYVKTTDWIAKVGNSGTSNGALGTDEDLHLHSDILVCGKNFWEYGDISDMNNSLIDIFDKAAKAEQNATATKKGASL